MNGRASQPSRLPPMPDPACAGSGLKRRVIAGIPSAAIV